MWKEGWVAKLPLMILCFQPKTAREPGLPFKTPGLGGASPVPSCPISGPFLF